MRDQHENVIPAPEVPIAITPRFWIHGRIIHIHSRPPRIHRYSLRVIATFLIVLPFMRSWFPPGALWFSFDGEGGGAWFGLIVYLFAIGACLSATRWWSKVQIDLAARHVTLDTRWGVFWNTQTVPLAAFEKLVAERDSESTDVSVNLVGCISLTIIWGCDQRDALKIARKVADELAIPLVLPK